MKHLKYLATMLFLIIVQESFAVREYTYYPKIDGIYYRLDSVDHKAKLTGEYSSGGPGGSFIGSGHYSGDVVIPSSIEYEGVYYRVTSLYLEAFWGEEVTLTIPESITDCFPGYGHIDKLYISSWDWYFNKTLLKYGRDMMPLSFPDYNHIAFSEDYAPCLLAVCDSLFVNGEYVDLEDFVVPDGIEYLPGGCFMYMKQLRSVTIPRSVKAISGHGIFWKCENLKYIVSYLDNPTELSGADELRKVILYVPEGTAEKYRQLRGWREAAEIIEFDVNEGVVIPGKSETEGLQSPCAARSTDCDVYDLQGRRTANSLSHGFYISNGKKFISR